MKRLSKSSEKMVKKYDIDISKYGYRKINKKNT